MITRLSERMQTVTPAGLSSRDREGANGPPPPQTEPAKQGVADADRDVEGGAAPCSPGACTYQQYGSRTWYDHASYHAAERVLTELNKVWWEHTDTCKACAAAEIWDGRQCEPERELSKTLARLERQLGLHDDPPAGARFGGWEA